MNPQENSRMEQARINARAHLEKTAINSDNSVDEDIVEDNTSDSEKRLIEKLKRELGVVCLNALNDPEVIEIMLNSDGILWVEKLGSAMTRVGVMQESKSKALIGTIASYLNTTVTPDNPILECELPIDGSRFEGLLPPVVARPTFTIRKKATKIFTLDEYLEGAIINKDQYDLIAKAIYDPADLHHTRRNILIVGSTGSGKTTLTNAVIDGMVKATSDDRIVIIEDTAEIQCSARNSVILRATNKVNMLTLLKATMRLRPDRILVGEVRGREALDLLKAWNTGHSGGVATVHANSAKAGLIRMEQLISEATTAPMHTLIAEAINVVIYIAKTQTGRVVKEIIEVVGYDKQKEDYILKEYR